jgi:peptidyl-prolyl cis-trans isomerase SurA
MTRTWKQGLTKIAAAFIGLLIAGGVMVSTATASDSVEVIDRIVAQVNDEIITYYELEQAALPYMAQRGTNPRVLQDDDQREEVLSEVLDELVDRILMEQEARRQGVEVRESQVDEWMAMTQQQQGMTDQQFRQMIAQHGIDYDDYRQIIRDNLLQMQLLQMRGRGGAVSRSEVESEYRRRFGEPADIERRLEFRHILLVPDEETGGEQGAIERASELRQRIVDGESFAELAETYSQGPGSSEGGYLGTFSPGDLASSFEDVAFVLEDGELSEPVLTDFGVHIIEVLSEEEVQSERVTRRMEQIQMELQEREAERQMRSYLQTLRARAFVDIRY